MTLATNNLERFLLLEASKSGKHMTMNGKFVNCHSIACKKDLQKRIADAIHSRDHASTRSDERAYYNGVLRVLRRRLREVEKTLASRDTLNEYHQQKRLRRRTSREASTRLLQKAGIF